MGGKGVPRLSQISEDDQRAKGSSWYQPPPVYATDFGGGAFIFLSFSLILIVFTINLSSTNACCERAAGPDRAIASP